MKRIELLLGQITAGSARPDWTLFALSSLLSATLVLAMQSISEPSLLNCGVLIRQLTGFSVKSEEQAEALTNSRDWAEESAPTFRRALLSTPAGASGGAITGCPCNRVSEDRPLPLGRQSECIG